MKKMKARKKNSRQNLIMAHNEKCFEEIEKLDQAIGFMTDFYLAVMNEEMTHSYNDEAKKVLLDSLSILKSQKACFLELIEVIS